MAKANLNKVILIGRLGKDPDCKLHEGGWTSARFTMATERAYKKKDDKEWTIETDWHNVDAVNATFVEKFLKKGSLVMVEGYLTARKYTGNDGTEKYYHFVKGKVSLIDNGIEQQASTNAQPPKAHVPEETTYDENPDDLPF
jgi:single-strand DNA-binding protein